MPVAIASMPSDAYAEEQKGKLIQLSKLAKWQWLELDAILKHVFLAHQYLDIHQFIHAFSQSVSQSQSLICDLVVKVQMHTFL